MKSSTTPIAIGATHTGMIIYPARFHLTFVNKIYADEIEHKENLTQKDTPIAIGAIARFHPVSFVTGQVMAAEKLITII